MLGLRCSTAQPPLEKGQGSTIDEPTRILGGRATILTIAPIRGEATRQVALEQKASRTRRRRGGDYNANTEGVVYPRTLRTTGSWLLTTDYAFRARRCSPPRAGVLLLLLHNESRMVHNPLLRRRRPASDRASCSWLLRWTGDRHQRISN